MNIHQNLSYSILMSVYAKEKPEYLSMAIQSMLDQTVPSDDFVIVCDGPLTPELNEVLETYCNIDFDRFQILRLEMNQGLGNALNAGIGLCKNELVARMDSDDIALPYRCEHQLRKFEGDPELCLCGGDISEFDSDPTKAISIRHVPETHEDIINFARKRNPMNHMSVMYKKSSVQAVGGYIGMEMNEDYYLWARMLQKGCRCANINEVLVKVRVGNGMYARRGGWNYAQAAIRLQKELLQMRFISELEYVRNCLLRIFASVLPLSMRKYIYRKGLRRSVK